MLIATILVLIILAGFTVFQIALAFGAPIGQFAWGGQHKVLPTKFRIGSAISPVIYAIIAMFALSKSGLWTTVQDQAILTVGLWIITVYFFLGIIMNSISRSKYEQRTITPFVAVLFVCFLVITLA